MKNKTVQKKIDELYEASRYLRSKSMQCESDEQTKRIRKKQNEIYQKWLFLKTLKNKMAKNKIKK